MPLTPDDYTKARRQQLADEGWLPARFRGRCVVCGSRFDEGTMLHKEPRQIGWRGECCADTVDDEQE